MHKEPFKFKWKKFGLTLLSISASFSFAGNIYQHNTVNNYKTIVMDLEAAAHALAHDEAHSNNIRFVPDPNHKDAYKRTTKTKLDSVDADKKEDGSNIDRKYGGRSDRELN